MRVVISDTVEDACFALTESMIGILKSIHNRDVYIAISGGSTPAKLFDLWAYRYEHEINWKRIHLFWVDERCVPPADKESNYRMTAIHMLNRLPFAENHIHRIHGEADPEQEAERYENIVKKLLPWEDGMPVFDLILLGIGTDGHTASIFPGEEFPDSEEEDTALYKVACKPETGQLRITMTLPLINRAKHIFFLATGLDKRHVIADLFHHTPEADRYPANYIHSLDGHLISFFDRDAMAEACISPK